MYLLPSPSTDLPEKVPLMSLASLELHVARGDGDPKGFPPGLPMVGLGTATGLPGTSGEPAPKDLYCAAGAEGLR